MSRPAGQEVLETLGAYRDAPMVSPNKVYPSLPPAENITPLMRIPEKICITEALPRRQTVCDTPSTSIFERMGVTCSVYSLEFLIGTSPYSSMDMEIIGAVMMSNRKQMKSYRFKALESEDGCDTLYLRSTILCLLLERSIL